MTPAEIVAAYEVLVENVAGLIEDHTNSRLLGVYEASHRDTRSEIRVLRMWDDGTASWSVTRSPPGRESETTTYYLPAHLVGMSVDDRQSLAETERTARRERWQAHQAERDARNAADVERRGRELLAQLKQKYEGTP